MSAIKAIYNAPIVGKAVLPDAGEVSIIIQYHGRIYQGVALLHPEDKDFFSEKVGCNIALSRARIEALQDTFLDAQIEAQIKQQMLNEVLRFGLETGQDDKYDPTQMFRQNVNHAINRKNNLKKALIKEKNRLINYIANHGKAIQSIKLHRAKTQDESE